MKKIKNIKSPFFFYIYLINIYNNTSIHTCNRSTPEEWSRNVMKDLNIIR